MDLIGQQLPTTSSNDNGLKRSKMFQNDQKFIKMNNLDGFW
jgi:hypothetical protein